MGNFLSAADAGSALLRRRACPDKSSTCSAVQGFLGFGLCATQAPGLQPCAGHACSHSPNALSGCMPSQGLLKS